MDKERFRKILIALIVISLVFQIYKSVAGACANNFVKQVVERYNFSQEKIEKIDKTFKIAKDKHLAVYLKDFSLKKPKSDLQSIGSLLEEAKKISHPSKKVKLAKQALEKIKLVNQFSGDWQQYFSLLDVALENYKIAPDVLRKNINDVRKYISQLEVEGYFAKNFEESRSLLQLADNKVGEAVDLSCKKFEENMSDYLQVYKICQAGEEVSKKANDSAKSIPALRASNEERIRKLQNSIDSISTKYENARYAAGQLERYPKYECNDELENAYNNLSDLETLKANAMHRNAMHVQFFVESAQALSEAEGKVSFSFGAFTRITNKWSEVNSAISKLASSKKEAESQIRRTNSYISRWSENSQGSAKKYVKNANEKISEGNRLQDSDPLASLDCYEDASDLARQGYNKVDDVDHTITVSDDDDDSGSSFFGGSYSSSDSSSSSSSYSTSSDSDSWGGSYDSGPSGGYDSGPSGGYDSGDDGF